MTWPTIQISVHQIPVSNVIKKAKKALPAIGKFFNKKRAKSIAYIKLLLLTLLQQQYIDTVPYFYH